MYNWISLYLTNRKALVQCKRHFSRKITKEGVLDNIPKWIHGALCTHDLAIWCSEAYTKAATVRMLAANNQRQKKTICTIFSLDTKEQNKWTRAAVR